MEKQNQNNVVNYKPVVVAKTGFSIDFSKSQKIDSVTFNGNIIFNENKVGYVGYSGKDNKLVLNLDIESGNVAAVAPLLKSIGESIKEIAEDN